MSMSVMQGCSQLSLLGVSATLPVRASRQELMSSDGLNTQTRNTFQLLKYLLPMVYGARGGAKSTRFRDCLISALCKT